MKKTKVLPVLLGLSALAIAASAGCTQKKEEYTTFTMFATMTGTEINSDNEVQLNDAPVLEYRIGPAA